MKFIYMLTNTITGEKYIGQTKHLQKRLNGHKSDSQNPSSHSYHYPLYESIRKYGWNKFTVEILEEIPEENPAFVDSREIYFIEKYDTYKHGFNITAGGNRKNKMSFEEKVSLSKIFTVEEVLDIQNLLIQGVKPKTILEKYSSRLTSSFLYNINSGDNFSREELTYPLHEYKKDFSSRFTSDEILEIQKEIIEGNVYKQIAEKWGISISLLSMINNGKHWLNEELTYPLCTKGTSRLHNRSTWVPRVQDDLMNSSLTMKAIAEKYKKAYSTIKKINSGSSHRNPEWKYPLNSNRA